jgi:hypothetical protein
MWVPKWIIAATVAVFALLILFGAGSFALRAFEGGICGNELIAADTAPSRRYKAIVFVRNCGATTTFGTHVSIVERDAQLHDDEVGNVLAIDATCCLDPRSRVLPRNSIGGPVAATRWIGSDTLSVTYASGVRVFRQTLVYREIPIVYAKID